MTGFVNWNGDEVVDRVVEASKTGAEQTAEAAAQHARENHEFENVSGRLEASIEARPVEEDGDQVGAEFGSYGVDYAIPVEVGSQHASAKPYLRPAQDAEATKMAGRIREDLEQ